MEHVHATTSLRQQQQQQQHTSAQSQQPHQQHYNPPQHHFQHYNQQPQHHYQQSPNDAQQQFCLRWHNHQTSLLSSLPVLLDQSHLTDVTISAEGRTLRAHRVVLSACSTFFMELFRTLDNTSHPVIIIPGASFAAIVALLTFMYSGEVNVFEEQIPALLSLAETLGIKGLADVPNNKAKEAHPDSAEEGRKGEIQTPPTPLSPLNSVTHNTAANTLLPPPLAVMSSMTGQTSSGKIPTPLESLFLKSLQFYPNLLPQPLNFSQSALNKSSDLLAKYQQQCNFYQSTLGDLSSTSLTAFGYGDETTELCIDDSYNPKRLSMGEKKLHQQQQQKQKDIKRIDKVVENLRCGSKTQADNTFAMSITGNVAGQQQKKQEQQEQQLQQTPYQQMSLKAYAGGFVQNVATNASVKPMVFATSSPQQPPKSPHMQCYLSPEDQSKLQQLEQFTSCNRDSTTGRITADGTCLKIEQGLMAMPERLGMAAAAVAVGPSTKAPSNSKLYATCFICHKQLSNQYNLRVHLETHQNVRYACNVCSHVSRSKDALRKHVSYRHPGAPSPCESETRRKRSKVISGQMTTTTMTVTTADNAKVTTTASIVGITTSPLPPSTPTTPSQVTAISVPVSDCIDTTATSSLCSTAYRFLPNQQRQFLHNTKSTSNDSNSQNQSVAITMATVPAVTTTATTVTITDNDDSMSRGFTNITVKTGHNKIADISDDNDTLSACSIKR